MSSSSKNIISIIVLLACVAVVIWFFQRDWGSAQSASRPPAAIPVVVTEAVRTDVPHLLNTVGTVESLHSVVVRPQIEGVLTAVLFEEGQDVEKGQLIATIDDRVLVATLNSQKAELASNNARLHSAEADLERYRNLAQHNAIPRQTLEQQEALVEGLKADTARNEASIEDARVRLSYTQILSPVSGRVGIRKVDPGNLVRPTDAEGIVTVTQMHPISVLFTVAQNSLEPLRRTDREPEGAPVQVIDRSSAAVLATGPISAIDNTVRTGSGTVQIRALFDNQDERLWPGQFVAVRVPVGRSRNAITVPSVAVRLGLDSSFVYRLGADSSVELVPVRVIYRDEDERRAIIEGDIEAGDSVIVDGFVRLTPGAKVTVIAPPKAVATQATDQPAGTDQPTAADQPAGKNQPTGTSQPTAADQPAGKESNSQ